MIYLLKHLDKLRDQLAEADAALAVRKKPPEDTGPRFVGEGLVIDEWVSEHHLYYFCVIIFILGAFTYRSHNFYIFTYKNIIIYYNFHP